MIGGPQAMAGIQSLIRRRQTTLLLLLLAGGFAVILAELVLYKHYSGIQLIGFISTIAGLLVVLWGLFAKGRTRVVLALVLLLLSVTGIIGVIQHNEGDEDGEAVTPAFTAAAANLNISSNAPRVVQENESEEEGSGESARAGETIPPPLAPLGLSGLALMGAVVLLAKRDPDESVVVA